MQDGPSHQVSRSKGRKMPVWAVVDSRGVPQPGSVQPTELRAIVAFVSEMKAKNAGSPDWSGWRDDGYSCRRFALERAPETDHAAAPAGALPRDDASRTRPHSEKGT
jgi:hypothetical protein